jgi:hypothetical protein
MSSKDCLGVKPGALFAKGGGGGIKYTPALPGVCFIRLLGKPGLDAPPPSCFVLKWDAGSNTTRALLRF